MFRPTNFERLKTGALELIRLINVPSQYDKRLVPDRESFRNQLTVLYNNDALQGALTDVKDTGSLLKKMFALNLSNALPFLTNSLVVS